MKIYYNGPILTMEDNKKTAEILIEQDGRILFVGKKEEAHTYITDDAEWIDLSGHTLMPALLDAHSHISDTAMLLKSANLQEAHSFDDVTTIFKAFIAEHSTSQEPFIVGLGYDHNALAERRHPDKTVLDAASSTRPIVMVHTSLHMCVVNSKMLEYLGIDEDTVTPEGGIIGRVGESLEPNGYLEELAFNPIYELVCKQLALTSDDIANAQQVYLKNGILTIQEGSTDEPVVQACRKAADEGKLVCDLVAYPCFNFGRGIGRSFEDNADCIRKYKNHFKIGGYKLILDGSPQGRTAWMSEPYEDSDDFCSSGWLSDDEVQQYTTQCIRNHQQVLAHCNGDAAAEQFINACEQALNEFPDDNARPVMIHCQTVRDDQLDRMAKLGIIPSIFVDHVYYWGDIHLKNFGPVRGPHISPAKAALERNMCVNFHTDCPVVMPHLFQTAWTAVNRITKNGIVLGADQCIDIWDALKALTINAAYGYFEEHEKGSLKVGKLADLIIIDQNPLTVDKMSLKNIHVLECIKEGETVYCSQAQH